MVLEAFDFGLEEVGFVVPGGVGVFLGVFLGEWVGGSGVTAPTLQSQSRLQTGLILPNTAHPSNSLLQIILNPRQIGRKQTCRRLILTENTRIRARKGRQIGHFALVPEAYGLGLAPLLAKPLRLPPLFRPIFRLRGF